MTKNHNNNSKRNHFAGFIIAVFVFLSQQKISIVVNGFSSILTNRHVPRRKNSWKIATVPTNTILQQSDDQPSLLFSAASPSGGGGTTVLEYVDRLLLMETSSSSSPAMSVSNEEKEEEGSLSAAANERIMKKVDSLLDEDFQCAKESPLVLEERDFGTNIHQRQQSSSTSSTSTTKNDFEWMNGGTIAVESIYPIFEQHEISSIRSAAEDLWASSTSNNSDNDDDDASTTSRFTYQYPGNSEAHVSDFQSPDAIRSINRALQERLYPMIRDKFDIHDDDYDDDDDSSSTLYVYDALMIRYNATASNTGQAGQPLHRDLGIVSVNVMLNSAVEFEGGGTAFENDLEDGPKKPSRGAGHCLAHRSSERHAGASTHSGVRDILVFFVAGTKSHELQTARIKQTCRSECDKYNDNGSDDAGSNFDPLLCRIRYYRLAVEVSRDQDGESYLYLGTALMEYAAYHAHKEALEAAIECFRQAQIRIPCDARVYNNLGISLGRLKQQQQQEPTTTISDCSMLDDCIEEAYERGLRLLIKSSDIGCNVEQDLDSLSLNYGLYLANQDRFARSRDVLARFVASGERKDASSKMIQDAVGLWKFCDRQVKAQQQ